ncbi:MAG: lipid IV(A) 3-deoxy-D-manno-octulosonic acid transferase [Gammaproteobacteria bacterium]|nr:lipid IV(A) 3-deoxy-D-manno-octulosonic acid transferase [Gammaproteobacteria bacterium]
MYFLYSILTYLLLPLALVYLWLKSFKQSDFRKGFLQRLGMSGPESGKAIIWVHGASVGEVVAATPLIRRLLLDYPNHDLLVSTLTPTGATRVRETFGDQVLQCYLPLDAGFAVRGFIRRFQPDIAIIMETEIWPTLYRNLDSAGIPVVIASGRMSQKSVDGYKRFRSLIEAALDGNVWVAAQAVDDRQRFVSLGAVPDRALVTGNIKYDFDEPEDIALLGQQFRMAHGCTDRPVWVAASTHEGEEEQVLAAHEALLKTFPDALLLLVPRHPERFDSVAKLIRQKGMITVRRSSSQICDAHSQVFLGDSMGEMMMFYAAADVAFVGGSLVNIGGHNLLEPASLGKAIICGPSMSNAKDVAEMLFAAGALQIVENSAELNLSLNELLARPSSRDDLGNSALKVIKNNRGALDRLMAFIGQVTEA